MHKSNFDSICQNNTDQNAEVVGFVDFIVYGCFFKIYTLINTQIGNA